MEFEMKYKVRIDVLLAGFIGFAAFPLVIVSPFLYSHLGYYAAFGIFELAVCLYSLSQTLYVTESCIQHQFFRLVLLRNIAWEDVEELNHLSHQTSKKNQQAEVAYASTNAFPIPRKLFEIAIRYMVKLIIKNQDAFYIHTKRVSNFDKFVSLLQSKGIKVYG